MEDSPSIHAWSLSATKLSAFFRRSINDNPRQHRAQLTIFAI